MARLKYKIVSRRDDYDKIIHNCTGMDLKYEPLERMISEVRREHEEKLKESYLIERIETRIRSRIIR